MQTLTCQNNGTLVWWCFLITPLPPLKGEKSILLLKSVALQLPIISPSLVCSAHFEQASVH